MFFHIPIRTGKCNKRFSCNLFGVILHIDSTIVWVDSADIPDNIDTHIYRYMLAFRVQRSNTHNSPRRCLHTQAQRHINIALHSINTEVFLG